MRKFLIIFYTELLFIFIVARLYHEAPTESFMRISSLIVLIGGIFTFTFVVMEFANLTFFSDEKWMETPVGMSFSMLLFVDHVVTATERVESRKNFLTATALLFVQVSTIITTNSF